MKQLVTIIVTLILFTSGMPVKLTNTVVTTSENQEIFDANEHSEDFIYDDPGLYGKWFHPGYSRMFVFGRKGNGILMNIVSHEEEMLMLPKWGSAKILKSGGKAYDVVLSRIPGEKTWGEKDAVPPGSVTLYWIKPKNPKLKLLDTQFTLILPIIDEEDTKTYGFVFQ